MSTTTSSVIFIKGKKVILRPMEETDLPQMQIWINRAEIRQNILVFRPMSARDENEWHEKIRKNDNGVQFAICNHDGDLIGSTGVFNINWQHRFAMTGTVIGDAEYRHKGFGTDAKMNLLNYAFNTLNLHRMITEAFEFNDASLRYSLKCGYKEEGRLRQQFFKNGRYWDAIQLGVLREEWLPLWEEYNRPAPV
jgi:RimJ/RimL family protein N-acetyltransferase